MKTKKQLEKTEYKKEMKKLIQIEIRKDIRSYNTKIMKNTIENNKSSRI